MHTWTHADEIMCLSNNAIKSVHDSALYWSSLLHRPWLLNLSIGLLSANRLPTHPLTSIHLQKKKKKKVLVKLCCRLFILGFVCRITGLPNQEADICRSTSWSTCLFRVTVRAILGLNGFLSFLQQNVYYITAANTTRIHLFTDVHRNNLHLICGCESNCILYFEISFTKC